MPSEISNGEAIEMMNRCKAEIISLRNLVEHLRPKAEAYDNIAAVLRLLPQQRMGMEEDLVWALEKRIHELTLKEPPNAEGI